MTWSDTSRTLLSRSETGAAVAADPSCGLVPRYPVPFPRSCGRAPRPAEGIPPGVGCSRDGSSHPRTASEAHDKAGAPAEFGRRRKGRQLRSTGQW